jgi:EAL domain-containing protein (putative c-di-GMP-specific phosphodiesterase class I)
VRGTRIAALSTLGDDHWDGTLVAPIRVGGTEVRVPYRLGISVAPADGNDAEQLYRQAEAALHRAQAAGDTCVYFSAAINALAASRFELGARLRRAVEAREFVLHYQPKVDLRSRRLVGVEALLRWRNPQGETVQPAEFVPVLEETGLIIDVGRWAIEQAVADIAWWQTCGLRPPRVSLNVSAVQLRQPNFVGQLLAASGGPQNAAAMIDLEVTEGERAQDMGPAMEALQQLRQLGVGVIMDDFGTGRSSLSQLTELPVSAVKIDRSLVQDLASRPAALAIVVSVIGLAKSLGITSLAEGVEDEATASRLHELGCDQAQGFLFGRPVAANAIATLLQSVEASGAGSAAVSPLRSSRRSR